MAWFNSDGLLVKLGTEEATAGVAGEFPTVGYHRIVEVKLDLTTLNTSTQTILDDNVWLPKNARIEEVEFEVQTGATSSGSGTIDFGLIQMDRSTELDYDGLVAAEVKGTVDTAGKRVQYITGTSKAGALIGTTLANPGYFAAKLATAVYQTGVILARVKFVFL